MYYPKNHPIHFHPRLLGLGAWKLQADLISFNSAISACGTSAAWRMAVLLLQRCWDWQGWVQSPWAKKVAKKPKHF